MKYLKLLLKYNKVVAERDALKESIKDELYKDFMKRLGEPIENERLKKENKRLRKKIKEMKEDL